MSYAASQANSDLLSVTHGITINAIPNLVNLHNRTARKLLNDIDPIETIRYSLTTTPIYSQVWDYAAPSDLKGNRIVDILPPYTRLPGQIISQTFLQPFDIDKNLTIPPSEFSVKWNNQVKTLRINDTSVPTGTILDTCDVVGNFTAGGTASALAVDNQNFAVGAGSLSFNVTTGTGFISETLTAALDLSAQLNQASVFYYLYLPSGSALTSTEVRWGSDASNYYSRVLTQTNEGNAFATGWNLIRGDWLGATQVGTPVNTAIKYLYIGVTVTSNQTGVRVDNVISNLGLYRTIVYYSKYLFRNASTSVFSETIQDTTGYSDLINLDTDSYNLYFNLLAYYAAQQLQGLDALFYDANFFLGEYEKDKQKYQARQPSQVQKSRQDYYKPVQGGMDKFLGKRFYL